MKIFYSQLAFNLYSFILVVECNFKHSFNTGSEEVLMQCTGKNIQKYILIRYTGDLIITIIPLRGLFPRNIVRGNRISSDTGPLVHRLGPVYLPEQVRTVQKNPMTVRTATSLVYINILFTCHHKYTNFKMVALPRSTWYLGKSSKLIPITILSKT